MYLGLCFLIYCLLYLTDYLEDGGRDACLIVISVIPICNILYTILALIVIGFHTVEYIETHKLTIVKKK